MSRIILSYTVKAVAWYLVFCFGASAFAFGTIGAAKAGYYQWWLHWPLKLLPLLAG